MRSAGSALRWPALLFDGDGGQRVTLDRSVSGCDEGALEVSEDIAARVAAKADSGGAKRVAPLRMAGAASSAPTWVRESMQFDKILRVVVRSAPGYVKPHESDGQESFRGRRIHVTGHVRQQELRVSPGMKIAVIFTFIYVHLRLVSSPPAGERGSQSTEDSRVLDHRF